MTAGNGRAPDFDLDAAKAARREATGARFTFRFGGRDFEIKPAGDWPIASQAELGELNFPKALPGILVGGEADYLAIEELGAVNDDMEAIFAELGRWSGVGSLPNSPEPSAPASTPT